MTKKIEDDTRNVLDKYKSLPMDTIIADLNRNRMPFEIAIENLERDFNMGTIIRTANAFNVQAVHIIGRRQWNKRGAMMTDKYMDVIYQENVPTFIEAMSKKSIIAVDNTEGSVELAKAALPSTDTVFVFGSEANGISDELLAQSEQIIAIEQFGSTRSLNVGVAAGIVMYEWVRRNHLHSV